MSAPGTTLSSAVEVIVRTRPTASFANENIELDTAGSSITTHARKLAEGPVGSNTINNQRDSWNFRIDKILHNSSQETVYETGPSSIVDSVLQV